MTAVLDRPLLGITDADNHRTRDASAGSFEAFYKAEYHDVVGLCYLLFGNRSMAEDLAQDAFAEAHQHWSKVRHYDKPGAWVRRVLINKSQSRLRRLLSEKKAVTLLGGRRLAVTELPEWSDGIWSAVTALPPRQAQVIALRYWDGLSNGEIAEVLGCGSETVKTHLKRVNSPALAGT